MDQLEYEVNSLHYETSVVEEGIYEAEIVDFRKGKDIETKLGTVPSILCSFRLSNGEIIVQSILLFNNKKNLIDRLVEIIMDHAKGKVNLIEMIGKKCKVEIKHNLKGDKTYANVVEIYSLDLQND